MSELYKEAAELLQKLERREGGLKSLAYAENVQHKRSSFALVCETLRFKPLLQQLLDAVPQFKMQKKLKGGPQRALLLISLYDLLFGREKIQGGGHMKKELMQFANAFKTALVRLKIKAKVASNEALLPKENRKSELLLPRYVRVNTLKISPEELAQFKTQFADAVQEDAHLTDLLVLPPGTELHEHELVKSGKLILQDKASCFPAFVLHGERGDPVGKEGDVIDACAAPGNKTSHAAMLLDQQQKRAKSETERKVFAFDRSAKRLELLKRRMKSAGADGLVEACLQSFLEVDVNDAKYANVRAVLLDPSCSGSGMTNRLDHLLDIASSSKDKSNAEVDENEVVDGDDVQSRLQSLADFQLEALLKAFSFPQVERVSYSTCSIFQKENEEVVAAALKSKQNRQDPRPFVLRKCLPTWPRRGQQVAGLTAEQADALVRADGHEDNTNGFFVAYFERDASAKVIADAVDESEAIEEQPTNEDDENEEEAEEGGDAEGEEAVGGKRKQLTESQKESRKRRKKEKLKRKKQRKATDGEQQ